MLPAMMQHNSLHNLLQPVINIYSTGLNFLAEWRLSAHLMP